jgi:uncharacterized protein YecT (DUF1311 family)
MRVALVTAAVVAAMVTAGGAQQPSKAAPKTPPKSDPCANAMTQADMTMCSGKALEQANATLARIYDALLKDLDADHKPILQKAEAAWDAFRTAQCDLQASQYLGGSLSPQVASDCSTTMANQRIAALRKARKDLADFIK